MNIIVTGGSTFMPIDKVRGITNIFKGRTACDITKEAIKRKHNVCLIGNKEMFSKINGDLPSNIESSLSLLHYYTYDMLYEKMFDIITGTNFKPDVVIHSSAVSDYKVKRVLSSLDENLALDRSKKISSEHKIMYLELEQTEKIIDKIRDPWGFKGILVKFKLQVGMKDQELIDIANKSIRKSDADVIVANCLEWAHEKAYIISKRMNGEYPLTVVNRGDLASSLIRTVEEIASVSRYSWLLR